MSEAVEDFGGFRGVRVAFKAPLRWIRACLGPAAAALSHPFRPRLDRYATAAPKKTPLQALRAGIAGLFHSYGLWGRIQSVAFGVIFVVAVVASGLMLEASRVQSADFGSQTAMGTPELIPGFEDIGFFPVGEVPGGVVSVLDEDKARAWNAANPATGEAGTARAFFLPSAMTSDYERALHCMTAAIYYEAANEPQEGQRAVAQVIINRLRHSAYPKTICGVIWQGSERKTGCQFSFTCDGSLKRAPNQTLWARARGVASSALNGHVATSVGNATHYHADYVAPYWAPRLTKITTLGRHIFYRFAGAWGQPAAFRFNYRGGEIAPGGADPEEAVLATTTEADTVVMEVASVMASSPDTAPRPEGAEQPVLTGVPVLVVAAVDPAPVTAAPPTTRLSPAVADPLAPPRAEPRRSRRPVPNNW